MEQEQPGFAADKRADNDNRMPRPSATTTKVNQSQPKQETFGERWSKVQPTKTTVFWLCLVSILMTLILGFTWGGWVRGSTAQSMAEVTAQDAVVNRLAGICVAQFNMDTARDQKLQELQATSSFQRAAYVTTQGWATVPGDEEPERRVAEACAKQLMLINP